MAAYDQLLEWYDRATTAQRAAGQLWYPEARATAVYFADEYGQRVDHVCAIMSMLSVGVRWRQAKVGTAVLLDAWTRGDDISDLGLAAYKAQVNKVFKLLRDKPDEPDVPDYIGTKRALKTRSFYACINYPYTSRLPVVDRWMLHAIDIHGGRVSRAVYRSVAEDIRKVADEVNRSVPATQATIWVTIREAYNGSWVKERA